METTEKKPLVTFALFAYNQEQYIEEAVLGAFSQTYSPLEIVLSDDCSPDNTFAILEKMAKEYKGPHKIILNKNNKNLGLIGHINKIFLEIANGGIVVVAAGDDISLPERATQTWEVFDKDPKIMSVSMNYQKIDINSEIHKLKRKHNQGSYTLKDYLNKKTMILSGCSRAYKMDIFTTFGSLKPWCGVEDGTLVFRSILLGKSFHLNKLGVYYREINNSLSNSISINHSDGKIKQRIDDIKLALKNKIISDETFYNLQDNLQGAFELHKIILKFESTKLGISFFITKILLNKGFPIAEKLRLLKSKLKSFKLII